MSDIGCGQLVGSSASVGTVTSSFVWVFILALVVAVLVFHDLPLLGVERDPT